MFGLKTVKKLSILFIICSFATATHSKVSFPPSTGLEDPIGSGPCLPLDGLCGWEPPSRFVHGGNPTGGNGR